MASMDHAELHSLEPQVIEKDYSCNTTSLIKHVSGLFRDEQSSDITLTLEYTKDTFKVHKLVLSQSPVFRSMLYGNDWQESRSHSIHLTENEQYVTDMEVFLQFMYGIPVQISWLNVESLMYFGDKYAVDSLLNECLDFFTVHAEKNGDLLSALNAWKMIRKALAQQNDRAHFMFRVLTTNLKRLTLDESIIQSIDEDDLQLLLATDNVVCQTEFSVYKLVELWLLSKQQDTRLGYIKQFFPLIRLPYMHVQELSYIENSPKRLFPDESSQEFSSYQTYIKLLLCDAYKYHIMSKETLGTLMLQLPSTRLYLDQACMKFRLMTGHGLSSLTSWSKVRSSFVIYSTFSKFEQQGRKFSHEFSVTLMRKINAGPLAGSADRNRSSLLSLDISPMDPNKYHPFTCGHIFINERKTGGVLRRLLTSFDITDTQRWEIKLEGINFEDVSKQSIYNFTEDTGNVSLALDIILCTLQ